MTTQTRIKKDKTRKNKVKQKDTLFINNHEIPFSEWVRKKRESYY